MLRLRGGEEAGEGHVREPRLSRGPVPVYSFLQRRSPKRSFRPRSRAMLRPFAVLAALAVGLLVLSDGRTADGAGRRARRGRCCHSSGVPCGEACSPCQEAASPAPFLPAAYYVYCCCPKVSSNWQEMSAASATEAQSLVDQCIDQNGCTSAFCTELQMNLLGVSCEAFRDSFAPPPSKAYYVYCCCNGRWQPGANNPYGNFGLAMQAAQHCRNQLKCSKTIISRTA